jgi:hypothetical protein
MEDTPQQSRGAHADAVLSAKPRASFEEVFRYDEHGVSRIWKRAEDLDGVSKIKLTLGLREVREVVVGRTSEQSMLCGILT